MRKAQGWHCILISFLDGYDLWIHLYNKYNFTWKLLHYKSHFECFLAQSCFIFFIGFCLANSDEIFESHNNVSSESGFVRGLASKKHVRVSNKTIQHCIKISFRFLLKKKTPKKCFWRKYIVLFIDGAFLNANRTFHSNLVQDDLSTFNITRMHQSHRVCLCHGSFDFHHLLYFGFHS